MARQRLYQLAPGTQTRPWQMRSAPVPAGQTTAPGRPVVEIAISPDVIWFAARSLREHGTSYREAS